MCHLQRGHGKRLSGLMSFFVVPYDPPRSKNRKLPLLPALTLKTLKLVGAFKTVKFQIFTMYMKAVE